MQQVIASQWKVHVPNSAVMPVIDDSDDDEVCVDVTVEVEVEVVDVAVDVAVAVAVADAVSDWISIILAQMAEAVASPIDPTGTDDEVRLCCCCAQLPSWLLC